MSSEEVAARAVLSATIRDEFGRVVYSHKTHEKAREIESGWAVLVKWTNIVLTGLTSTAVVTTLITNASVALKVSAVLSTLTLAFVIFQLSFDPASAASAHRQIAKELWPIREQFINLLADLRCGLTVNEIRQRRDRLTQELGEIYARAPDTSGRAYRRAQRALKVREDMTFTAKEIDKFLPRELHEDSENVANQPGRDAAG